MTAVLLTIITGLIVNEFSAVGPWVAGKLVRWSAHRRYVPPAYAELRAEELAAYIDNRPGNLFKLLTALAFAVKAFVTRKIAPAVAPPNPLWWPTTLTVPVHYEDGKSTNRFAKVGAVCQPWHQLTEEGLQRSQRSGRSQPIMAPLRQGAAEDHRRRSLDLGREESRPPPKKLRIHPRNHRGVQR